MTAWTCPIRDHGAHKGPDGRRVETVRWHNGVAYCTVPGCGRFSITEEAAR